MPIAPAAYGQTGDAEFRPATGMHESRLRVALVNNMPDPALRQTEQQFDALLAAAAAPRPILLGLYTAPSVPRADAARQDIARRYQPFATLFETAPDAVVVTGTEPKAADLRREPYWDDLARIVDWVAVTRTPTLLSCLAAHAAVLHLSGIARTPLDHKCCGLFEETVSAEQATNGENAAMWLPHSRWNTLAPDALAEAGYVALSRSEAAGVGFFSATGGSPMLFCQGHPEYGPTTLLGEFRRDVRRFLCGDRPFFPDVPVDYFDQPTRERLAAYRALVVAETTPARRAELPPLMAAPGSGWQSSAARLVGGWLRAEQGSRGIHA